MRGVMRYANLQRRWIIHEELRHISETPIPNWPQCDGLIAAGVGEGPVLRFASERSQQIVRCSGNADPAEATVVCVDDYAVGRVAAEHLMDCRLEHFAFYGYDPGTRLSENRYNGFRQTLAVRGFTCHDSGLGWQTSIDRPVEYREDLLLQWLKSLPKPVGLMVIDDTASHNIAALCLKADIHVPDEIAIVGVNNDDLLCESAWPPLTSINCDYSRVGYMAAALLDRLLQGQAVDAEQRWVRLPPLGVVKRQSSDLLALENSDLADAVRYIRAHACDPCSVGDVLNHIPVGRRWLERQFVTLLGRTPHDEIMRVRLETARRLLLEPTLTLTDIAERCGFVVQQNFGRAFLQATGQTPGAYRRAALRGASVPP